MLAAVPTIIINVVAATAAAPNRTTLLLLLLLLLLQVPVFVPRTAVCVGKGKSRI